jgi:hypothetical protein
MTQIAHARRFDNTDDYLEMADGDLLGAYGPLTFAFIIKPISDTGANRNIINLDDSNNVQMLLHDINGVSPWWNSGSDYSANSFCAASNGWMLIAYTKNSGASTGRFHKYVYGTSTWTHVNSTNGTKTDPPTVTSGYECFIGYRQPQGIQPMNADLALLGVWRGVALSDGELEAMSADLASWVAESPNALWLFNQTEVTETVLDLAGSADEIARAGTSVQSISDLPFDVGGEAAVAATFHPARRRGR